jgi:hypothetical protein
MRGFKLWRHETGRSFIAFVQAIDPTVPAERDKYVSHQSVVAARYLRRLVEAPQTVHGKKNRSSLSPLELLAVLVKSAMPFVRPYEDDFWAQVAATSRWHERDLARLKVLAKRAKPISLRADMPRLVAPAATRPQASRYAAH